MVEVERDFASKGVAGAGLGLGIAGTALGLLNGGIPNILGGWGGCNGNNWGAGVCHENMPINRYEAGLQASIAAKDSQIALRDANTYNDQKLLEVYKYFDGQLRDVRDTLCAQAVTNQKTADSFTLAAADLAAAAASNARTPKGAEHRPQFYYWRLTYGKYFSDPAGIC